jgi:ABC-type transport system substrate-binding protein
MVILVVSTGPAPLEYPRYHNGRSKGLSRFIFAESSFYRGFLILMNDQKDPFNDRRIRAAVDYLLPYPSLQRVVGDPPAANPVTGYQLRRTDARRYMAEAGYPQGGFSVSLLVGDELTFYRQWGGIILQALRSARIGVTVKSLDSNEVVRRVKSGNYQMAIVQASRLLPQSLSQGKDTAKIVSVDCLQNFKLRVKIRIVSEGGIKNYTVGTTWGPGRVEETYSSSYPKVIDKTVVLDKKIKSDSQRRRLQVGLWVKTVESRYTLSDFMFEPQGKCPGH